MWIRSTNQLTKPGAYNLNFLYKERNVYIMDNHLGAAWAWSQEIDITKTYKIFHIDRHFDLIYCSIDEWLEQIRSFGLDISKCSIDDYMSLQFEQHDVHPNPIQVFRWDNYFSIFLRLYSHTIDSLVFATHKNGVRESEHLQKVWRDVDIWDLPTSISKVIQDEENVRWILNIDIDYFFTGNRNQFQFLTDFYIKELCNEIARCQNRIDVITIALSPDFTNGWPDAIRVAEMLANNLGLSFKFPATKD